MSRKWKTFLLSGAAAVACAITAILVGHASTQPVRLAKQDPAQTRAIPGTKNLSLQPEAARVNRRLAYRFKASGGPETDLSGTLTLGANKQSVTLVRRQTTSGEAVELQLAGRLLTWSDAEGTISTLASATESERSQLQRLVLDSPDQFVLAQLRGASYSTIMRNLRPDDAGENYTGPLWTVVRVGEPQPADAMAQTSRWRLYYINQSTELIDRVVSEENGQPIEARIEWTEWNGKPAPMRIKWTTNGQTIMEFEVATFSQK